MEQSQSSMNSRSQLKPPGVVRKRSVVDTRSSTSREEIAQVEDGLSPLPEQNTEDNNTQSRISLDRYNEKSAYNLWGLTDVGSVILENHGSVARDHMANERTFLSWIRTSLGLTTVGVGITQLFKLVEDRRSTGKSEFLLRAGKPIGGTFIAIAIVCVLMGTLRFFKVQTLLQNGKYPASRFSVSALVLLVFALGAVTLGTVIYADT